MDRIISGFPTRERIHTDDSIEVRYYNKPESTRPLEDGLLPHGRRGLPSTAADFAVPAHQARERTRLWAGCSTTAIWFHKDLFAVTLGGGEMSNWGRYLTLLPPIDGADAVTGSPYFPELPGQRAHMWDSTVTFQYMPKQYITWWAEVGYRHSDIPYFAGRGGVTPPGRQQRLSAILHVHESALRPEQRS